MQNINKQTIILTLQKTNGSVTKSTSSTKKQASTHKTKNKAIVEFQKGSIVGIRDFKKQSVSRLGNEVKDN